VAQDHPTRREVLKGAVYVTPAMVTLVAVPAFASSGSGRDRDRRRHHRPPKPSEELRED